MFFENIGQILCFIPEKIIDKFCFKPKEDPNKSNISYKLTYKDMIYISCASLFLLIIDYLNLLIQMNKDYTILLSEQYYFVLLLLLIIFSYLIYKIKFYKHQIYSISFIILLRMIRYAIKFIISKKVDTLYIFLELISTLLESIVIVYTKGLMEYKYFSPYKICYVFGLVNNIIIIIISLIAFFFIKYDNGNCYFQGKEICYFENLFIAIKKFGILSFLYIILLSVIYGILKFLYNMIMSKYTIFHLFLFIQNKEFINNLFNGFRDIIMSSIISISYILEFFMVLVFLEVIELNFWRLNENVKRKIKDRADDEVILSLIDMENKERNPSFDSSLEDDIN